MGEALGDWLGDGLGPGEAQVQSASSVQLGLTQRLVPPTLIQRKSDSHWASESQVSKQVIGAGDGLGEGEVDGLGLGDGEAVTVKLKLQTSSVVVSWTGGSWGEAVGRGRGVGPGSGCLSWKNKTTAVIKRMAVKPIKPQINHFLLFIGLTPRRYKQWPLNQYKPGIGLPSRRLC